MRAKLSVVTALAVASCAHGAGTLVGHWKFDEASGPTAFDAGPNGLHGALAGSAAFVAGGVSGNAIQCASATSDHVNMGAIPFNSSPVSLSLWIKTTTSAYQIIAGRHRATFVQGYFLGIGGGAGYGLPGKAHSYVSTAPGGEPISTTTVNDGQWRHLLMTHQPGGPATIYVDGVLEATRNPVYTATSAAFIVGGLFNPSSVPYGAYDGLVDDVQLYDGVLNGRQICHIVNNPGSAAVANIDGDVNGDGAVNFTDLNILLSGFNMTGFCMQGDVDGDGAIGFADLNRLLSNFNAGA